jgi:MYXO-CTERM domain-containing protein
MRFAHFAILGALVGGTLLGAAACAGNDNSKSGGGAALGKVSQAIETGVDGGATLALLNEIRVNPPGADEPYEFVELKGTPGGSLQGFYLVALEGDSGGAAGTADYVLNLSTACGGVCSFGTNGLLIVKAAAGGDTIAPPTTVVLDPQLNVGVTGGSGMENGSITFMLIYSPTTAIAKGTDYDPGTGLALPTGAIISDSIGWTDGGTTDVVYGGAQLAASGFTPDAVVRFPDDETPQSAAAWYGGDLTTPLVDGGDAGTNPASTTFSSTEITPNVAAGAQLTPGQINTGVKGVDAGAPEAGDDADQPDTSLPDVVMMPDTTLPEAASEVAMDAVGMDDVAVDSAPVDGAPADTGVALDTGVPVDTGVLADGGADTTPADTGEAPDTEPVDTGTAEDTGAVTPTDTGTAESDTGPDIAPPVTSDDEGCGCRTPGTSNTSSGAAFAAIALAMAVAARRRR